MIWGSGADKDRRELGGVIRVYVLMGKKGVKEKKTGGGLLR